MFYDMLHSPDFVVPDVRSTVRSLVDKVGLAQPRPGWYQCFPGHAYEAVFARVGPSRVSAPSRLEIISPYPLPSPVDPSVPRSYVEEIAALQGSRPVKTHATVVTTSDLPGLLDLVRSRGIRHRVDAPSPDLPHDRLWIGVSPDAPADYSPDDDAGLMLEFIPTQCLQLDPAVFDRPPPASAVAEGEMVRMVARCFLVDDLDRTLRMLAERMDWPVASITTEPATGTRRARMAAGIGGGATLELIQPVGQSAEVDFLKRWGPGPYAARISVAGLPAKADDLRRRGTRFVEVPGEGDRPDLLRVDTTEVPGVLLEFVDAGRAG